MEDSSNDEDQDLNSILLFSEKDDLENETSQEIESVGSDLSQKHSTKKLNAKETDTSEKCKEEFELENQNSKSKKILMKKPSIKVRKNESRGIVNFDPKVDYLKQIDDAFKVYLGLLPKPTLQAKRGRPLKDRSTNNLESLFNEWINLYVDKINVERKDAQLTTVTRHIKKVPSIFLHNTESSTHFKSKIFGKRLSAYLHCFIEGFLKFFPHDKNVESLRDLFLDFIITSFPKDKIEKFFEDLRTKGKITVEEFDNKTSQLVIVPKTSKSSMAKLYKLNKCIQTICNHIPTLIKKFNSKKIQNLSKTVLDKITK